MLTSEVHDYFKREVIRSLKILKTEGRWDHLYNIAMQANKICGEYESVSNAEMRADRSQIVDRARLQIGYVLDFLQDHGCIDHLRSILLQAGNYVSCLTPDLPDFSIPPERLPPKNRQQLPITKHWPSEVGDFAENLQEIDRKISEHELPSDQQKRSVIECPGCGKLGEFRDASLSLACSCGSVFIGVEPREVHYFPTVMPKTRRAKLIGGDWNTECKPQPTETKTMRERKLLRHVAIKGTLRRMRRKGFDSAAINEILGDYGALGDLSDVIGDFAEIKGVEIAGLFGGDGGSARPFLEWLWENREQIIEFVMMIIGMFGS